MTRDQKAARRIVEEWQLAQRRIVGFCDQEIGGMSEENCVRIVLTIKTRALETVFYADEAIELLKGSTDGE